MPELMSGGSEKQGSFSAIIKARIKKMRAVLPPIAVQYEKDTR